MRVAVIGTSGAGKSTFAKRLAESICTPHIELDAINWQPGWRALSTDDPDEFYRRVSMAVAGSSWVSDGNYGAVRDVVFARATHIVWLDYSRLVIMRRVIWRSAARSAIRSELWPGTGNVERISRWIDKAHPIRWAWDTHARRRRQYERLFSEPALNAVHKHRVARPEDLRAVESELVQQSQMARELR